MTDMETAIQAAITSGKINGAVICATDTKGQFTYNKAFGTRTLLSGAKQPQALTDVLYLASATKLITTIAALQCVEEGLLTLNDDLSTLAPELSKQVLASFKDGAPQLETPSHPITLKMLLTHSAGTTYHFMDPLIGKWREQFTNETSTQQSVSDLFCYPLSFQPGTSWMYGPGLDWAGLIIERVTGVTLMEYIQTHIFDPLGISDGQFYPVTREDSGGGGDMNARTKGDFGGHGLFLPGCDYIKILHSLLANDGKLLRGDSVEDMFRHHLSDEATVGHREALGGPAGVFFRVGTEVGARVGHGLGGLVTLEDVEGWYGEGTLTWGGGLTLAWFIDRKNDLCAVGAIQAALPVDVEVVSELKQVFRHDVYSKRAAWREQSREGVSG
ncbi:unnamed protein product [Penicillium salamii]|nr:unnamed protein product [Penicillium salamii]